MKKVLFLLLAMGGIMFVNADEANARHYHRGYHGYGHPYRGSGFSISFNRGYGGFGRYGYGLMGSPFRRSFGYSPGFNSPRYQRRGFHIRRRRCRN